MKISEKRYITAFKNKKVAVVVGFLH